jgi:hypothetical protein
MFYARNFLVLFLMSFFTLSLTPVDIQRHYAQQRMLNQRLFSPRMSRFLAGAIPAITALGLIYNAYYVVFKNTPITEWLYIKSFVAILACFVLNNTIAQAQR